MKRILALVLVALFICSVAYAEWVNSYTKSNGTRVSGYNRSSSNSTVGDNYSYKGNTNPYTGAVGTNYYRNSPSSEYYDPYSSSSRNSAMVNILDD